MALYGSYNPQYTSELQTANATALRVAAEVDSKEYTISGLPVFMSVDATPVVAFTFAPEDLKHSYCEITVQSVKTGGADGATYVRGATFRRSGATTTQIGSTAALVTQEDTAGQDCTVAASGANVQVTVTGGAYDVYWSAVIKVRSIGYLGV